MFRAFWLILKMSVSCLTAPRIKFLNWTTKTHWFYSQIFGDQSQLLCFHNILLSFYFISILFIKGTFKHLSILPEQDSDFFPPKPWLRCPSSFAYYSTDSLVSHHSGVRFNFGGEIVMSQSLMKMWQAHYLTPNMQVEKVFNLWLCSLQSVRLKKAWR